MIKNEFEETPVSKTRLKQQMQDLQNLGVKLVGLNKEQLAKFDLPTILLEAIKLAQKINSNGAIRRQYQYIGKLMRNVDIEPIKNVLAEITGESIKSIKSLHLSEKWRQRLLEEDDALNQFLNDYPNCDKVELCALIKNVKREIQEQKKRDYRKLFQYIRDIVEDLKE